MSKVKVKSPETGDQQHSSPAETLIDRITFRRGISRFRMEVLYRLVETILTCTQDNESDTDLLLHLPKSLAAIFIDKFVVNGNVNPDHLLLSTVSSPADEEITYQIASRLPDGHPLRDELLIVLVGKPMCILVAAHQVRSTETMDLDEHYWSCIISFLPEEISVGTELINDTLEPSIKEDKICEWLAGISKSLTSNREQFSHSRLWGNFLINVSDSFEDRRRNDRDEIKWLQIIAHIQEAVGWELDQERLFHSVARVLKESFGYHYLELQLLHNLNDKIEITGTFQQNDTSYGGKLLSLILKPNKQHEIIQRQDPVFIDSPAFKQIFANATLVELMGLKSGVILPLIEKNNLEGLLILLSSMGKSFMPADINLFTAISRIITRSLENTRKHYRMRRMATVDGLTNVYNRRFFSEQMTREFNRARRYNSDLSLIMIDIDHFKHYNDTNGHLLGDNVLTDLAGILKSSVRDADLVARYGGEEFAVILPETDIARGRVVAEKIRLAIESHKFKNEKKQPDGKVTISLGVATETADMDESTDLINCSDIALYRAKKAGRNRCVAYDDEEEFPDQ